jgi:hypothetical protein
VRLDEKSVWAGFAFVALLVILFFGLGQAPNPGTYPFLMFTGLIAAGATGALVRSLIWGSDKKGP